MPFSQPSRNESMAGGNWAGFRNEPSFQYVGPGAGGRRGKQAPEPDEGRARRRRAEAILFIARRTLSITRGSTTCCIGCAVAADLQCRCGTAQAVVDAAVE